MEGRQIFPRSLQYLIAIAEHGSYTRAAEALHVSQPSLSQQIKQLEETLKSPLFDRSGRSIRLTNEGEIYIKHAKRAWGELDAGTRAIHDVNNLSRGKLRLGWTPITDYLTWSLLEKFHRKFPGITLSTLEMPQDDIEIALIEDRIDIGIAISKPEYSASMSQEIETELLFEESLCVAVGTNHPRAGQIDRLSAQQLGRESLVLLNNTFALRRHLDKYFLDCNISPYIAIDTNSLSVIIDIIQNCPLATILPLSIVQKHGWLYAIKVVPDLPLKKITLISREHGHHNPASIAFRELATHWAGSR
tara:strand:+ start:1815 stop:2726 length:912 start_codon:yes stop_codon:yes gene_type:complete